MRKASIFVVKYDAKVSQSLKVGDHNKQELLMREREMEMNEQGEWVWWCGWNLPLSHQIGLLVGGGRRSNGATGGGDEKEGKGCE